MIKKFTLILLAVLSQSVFADDVTIVGSKKHTLKKADIASTADAPTADKTIQLLQVELSERERNLLTDRAKNSLSPDTKRSLQAQDIGATSEKIQLGMNNVPVLDQGIHGTCVTFALTAAMDAVLGKGDYISQLCNLQLGTYLENHGYGTSGWNGGHPTAVINQIEQYGIINKNNQGTFGCGGLTQYPTYSQRTASSYMEPEAYRAKSELMIGTHINWSDAYREDEEKTLSNVKQSLREGDRLVFAFLLPRTDIGFVGAVGRHKTWIYQDTWVLTPTILSGLDSIESAHEVIITGYDDDAVATDNLGKKHKGLLTLRNSWGTLVGNYGEFYMSYDYFKLLSFDVKRISRHSI